jgi:hypothetical protein
LVMEQISCTIVLYTNFVRGALALKSEEKPRREDYRPKGVRSGTFSNMFDTCTWFLGPSAFMRRKD